MLIWHVHFKFEFSFVSSAAIYAQVVLFVKVIVFMVCD